MVTIQSRSFHIALHQARAIVSLTWFDHYEGGGCKSQWVTVKGFEAEDWNRVRMMVNTLGEDAVIASLRDDRFSIFVDCKEDMTGIFDAIAQSMDPKQSILEWDKLLIATEELLPNA